METNRKTAAWLWRRTKAQHLRLLGLVIANACFSAISVLLALVCRSVIDAAVAGYLRRMWMSAAVFLGIVILQLILWVWLNRAGELVRSQTGMELRSYMADQMLKKEYAAVRRKHSGEWMNRMFSDVQIVAEGIAKIIPGITSMITRLLCAVGILFFLQPFFAYIFVAGGSVLIICTGVFRKRLKLLHREVQERQGKVQSFLQEMVENLLVIKVFGEEVDMEEKAKVLQQEHFAVQMKRRNLSICANAGFSFIFQIGYFVTLCWGAGGLYRGSMTYGTLAALLQLVGQIQAPVANLSGVLPQIYGLLASAERIMELEEYPEELPAERPEGEFQGITVSDVDFSYDTQPVLEKVNFTVRRGETVALTGLSGGGKSTIFLLLLGIYEAKRGTVVIETTRQRLSPGKGSRPLFAYVPQGNGLFSGTIRENIRFGREEIPEEKLWEALEVACAREFVEKLPLQLDTVVGEKGIGLSEGQSQRLSIARAILRETPVILLDEATSALDGATEAAVLRHIEELKDRTCLIVTHREAALAICKKQLQLDGGRIREKLLVPLSGRQLEKDFKWEQM